MHFNINSKSNIMHPLQVILFLLVIKTFIVNIKRIMIKIIKFLFFQDGVTAIEYALVAFLVAVVIVAAVTALGNQVLNLFNTVVAAF
ncbi:MAG: Flp family type IVb pilin [bacterium]